MSSAGWRVFGALVFLLHCLEGSINMDGENDFGVICVENEWCLREGCCDCREHRRRIGNASATLNLHPCLAVRGLSIMPWLTSYSLVLLSRIQCIRSTVLDMPDRLTWRAPADDCHHVAAT
jgi:hypothetical protein